jgi:hypothetical protein
MFTTVEVEEAMIFICSASELCKKDKWEKRLQNKVLRTIGNFRDADRFAICIRLFKYRTFMIT